jgi:hypothetical protein
LDPDLGGDIGPTFRTPILELMPNAKFNKILVIWNMNEIILAPCDVIGKIKQNSSDINEIILAPCDAGHVQSCTGLNVMWQQTLEAGNHTSWQKCAKSA